MNITEGDAILLSSYNLHSRLLAKVARRMRIQFRASHMYPEAKIVTFLGDLLTSISFNNCFKTSWIKVCPGPHIVFLDSVNSCCFPIYSFPPFLRNDGNLDLLSLSATFHKNVQWLLWKTMFTTTKLLLIL